MRPENMNLDNLVAKGNTAEIYLLDGKIVKLFYSKYNNNEAEYEANNQRIARACGLSVPQVFDVIKVNRQQAIVMEYIEGNSIGELVKENENLANYHLSNSVDIQIDIHSKTISGIENMKDKFTSQIQRADLLCDTEKIKIGNYLEELPLGNKLCHGDYHVFNVLVSEKDTFIIDWADASVGNPCADACRSYILYSEYSVDFANRYIEIYCEKSGISSDEILCWTPVISSARLSEDIPAKAKDNLLKKIKLFL